MAGMHSDIPAATVRRNNMQIIIIVGLEFLEI